MVRKPPKTITEKILTVNKHFFFFTKHQKKLVVVELVKLFRESEKKIYRQENCNKEYIIDLPLPFIGD